MKKLMILSSFFISSTFVFAQTLPNSIAKSFIRTTEGKLFYSEPVSDALANIATRSTLLSLSPAKTTLRPVGNQAPNVIPFSLPDLQRNIAQATILRSSQVLPATQLRSLLAPKTVFELRPTVPDLNQIAQHTSPSQTFLNGKKELLLLFTQDKTFEFFEPFTSRGKTIYTFLKKDIDVADPVTNEFYTIVAKTPLQFSQQDFQQAQILWRSLTQVESDFLLRRLRQAAYTSNGIRSFLFPEEFTVMVESSLQEASPFFGNKVTGKIMGTSTHISFTPVKQDLFVLTPEKLVQIKAGSFVNLPRLRLGQLEQSLTPAANVELIQP